MSIPIQTRLFQPFLGDQEGVGTRLLTESFCPNDSKNVVITELGRVSKFGGYDHLGVQPYGASFWTSLKTYSPGIANEQYLLAGYAGTYQLSVAALFQAEPTRLTTAGDVSWTVISGSAGYGDLPDMAQLGDNIIVTRPGEDVGYLTGSPPTFAAAAHTQINAPTVNDQANGVLTGSYKWKILPLIGTAKKIASPASTVEVMSDEYADLSWTADGDTNVTGYEIYRTTGTGVSYWYVDSVAGRTTVAYSDNTPDSTIIGNRSLVEYGDPPPSGVWFCEAHKQRMWYGNRYNTTSDDRRTVWYSDPGDFRSVNSDTNFFIIEDEKSYGDQITGLTGDFQNRLVVWLSNSIYTISGTGQVVGLIPDWTLKRSDAVVGTINHRTVASVPAGAKYTDEMGVLHQTTKQTLAFVTPYKDIRIFDGETDTVISWPKKDKLSGMFVTMTDVLTDSFHFNAFHDSKRGMVYWFLGESNGSLPQYALVWNYKLGTWHELDDCAVAAAVYAESGTSNEVNVIVGVGAGSGSIGDRTIRLFDAAQRLGTSFTSQIRFMPLYLSGAVEDEPDFTLVKRYRWVDLLFKKMSTPNDVTLTTYTQLFGPDEDVSGTPFETHSSISSTLRQRVSLKASGSSNITDGRFPISRGLTLVISEADSSSPGLWELEGIRIGYQALPGQFRD